MTQRFIPAAFIRGGSSKGVFFHVKDLPQERAEIDPILLGVLGSPDPYGRQLNGMGGGISSLSKAVIIGPPTRDDADVDYIFAQVSVDRPVVDWGANCGNLSSAVGPFAVDECLLHVANGEALVRIHQVNTGKIVHARFPVEGGRAVVFHGTGAPRGTADRLDVPVGRLPHHRQHSERALRRAGARTRSASPTPPACLPRGRKCATPTPVRSPTAPWSTARPGD
jgi:2-methylaconitate cis-trans-isomerase PrpF